MNYLSLFSGVGGGDLAFQHLLDGFRCVGYVEYEEYCQKVIRQRIKDGLLDAAPIFGDIREFNSGGYAGSYQGLVDLITGGDPCQANSNATTKPSQFPEHATDFVECIGIIKPKWVFRENPLPRKDAPAPWWKFERWLLEKGYNSQSGIFRACCNGLDHRRARVFTFGYHSDNNCESDIQANKGAFTIGKKETRPKREGFAWFFGRDESKPLGIIPNSDLCGTANDVAYRMDRLKAIGNGQVSIVAATAWKILKGER